MSVFLAELRRRNVIRMAGLYLVGAWLVVQVVETVLPIFDVPNWVLRAIVTVVAIGFLPALVFAWVFELTPTGLKREDEVPDGESIASATARRMNRAIVALLLLALVCFAVDRFVLSPRRAAAAEAAAPSAPPPTPSAAAKAADNSIAVLPFVNMSSDKEQEYFSDGLSEELLNLLAQVPNLRVVARTSSFSFKGKDVDIAAIAEALNVAHVLEGSVRKSGDTLRVTAQLVRASDSTRLWSRAFDRRMTDVFEVQDEIAGAVAEALRLELLPDQPLTTTLRSTNPEAYAQVLMGAEFLRKGSAADAQRAIRAFERALLLDPGYAGAHLSLSSAYWVLADYSGEEAHRRQALVEAEKCIAAAPGLAGCYLVRGSARISFQRDWAGAKADIDKARTLPYDVYLPNVAFRYLIATGQLDEAIVLLREGVAESPMYSVTWAQLGRMLNAAGKFDEARAALEQAEALNPAWGYTRFHLGANSLLQGRTQEALDIYRRIAGAYGLAGIALAEHSLGHDARSKDALRELVRDHGKGGAYQVAQVHAWRGERDQAFAWLDRALAQDDSGLIFVQADPMLASLVADPRYAALLRTMGLRD